MRFLPLCLVLAGCAASEPPTTNRPDPLTREIEGRIAGAPQQCVSTPRDAGLRVVDAQTITVRRGPTLFVSRLPSPCPGLRRDDRLIVESFGGNGYCRGDRIRSFPVGTSIPGPICPLGDFVPYRRPER